MFLLRAYSNNRNGKSDTRLQIQHQGADGSWILLRNLYCIRKRTKLNEGNKFGAVDHKLLQTAEQARVENFSTGMEGKDCGNQGELPWLENFTYCLSKRYYETATPRRKVYGKHGMKQWQLEGKMSKHSTFTSKLRRERRAKIFIPGLTTRMKITTNNSAKQNKSNPICFFWRGPTSGPQRKGDSTHRSGESHRQGLTTPARHPLTPSQWKSKRKTWKGQ